MGADTIDSQSTLGIDLSRASASRICNWLLGGKHHWAIDRDLGEQARAIMPAITAVLTANRAFVASAIRLSSSWGIRQYVDVGCGSPLSTTVHDLASIAPDSRCVYVDSDPIAVAHTELMLDERGDPDRHVAVRADIRESDSLWADVMSCDVVDPQHPIALIISSTLPFVPDGDDVAIAIARYKRLLPSGSVLIASHITQDGAPVGRTQQLAALDALCALVVPRITYRTREEFNGFFSDLAVIEPGVVRIPEWFARHAVAGIGRGINGSRMAACLLTAVGRKP